MARILPYIEQENLFRNIDLNQGYNVQPGVSSKRVGTFLCPSEANDKGIGTDPTYGNKHWTISYATNEGTWVVLSQKNYAMTPGDGAFAPNRTFRPADFGDGTSTTLAIAEVKAATPRLGAGTTPGSVQPAPTNPG